MEDIFTQMSQSMWRRNKNGVIFRSDKQLADSVYRLIVYATPKKIVFINTKVGLFKLEKKTSVNLGYPLNSRQKRPKRD